MMDQKKIQELISRSQQEDAVAFSLLVSMFQPLVFRLAFRLLMRLSEKSDYLSGQYVQYKKLRQKRVMELTKKTY